MLAGFSGQKETLSLLAAVRRFAAHMMKGPVKEEIGKKKLARTSLEKMALGTKNFEMGWSADNSGYIAAWVIGSSLLSIRRFWVVMTNAVQRVKALRLAVGRY